MEEGRQVDPTSGARGWAAAHSAPGGGSSHGAQPPLTVAAAFFTQTGVASVAIGAEGKRMTGNQMGRNRGES